MLIPFIYISFSINSGHNHMETADIKATEAHVQGVFIFIFLFFACCACHCLDSKQNHPVTETETSRHEEFVRCFRWATVYPSENSISAAHLHHAVCCAQIHCQWWHELQHSVSNHLVKIYYDGIQLWTGEYLDPGRELRKRGKIDPPLLVRLTRCDGQRQAFEKLVKRCQNVMDRKV